MLISYKWSAQGLILRVKIGDPTQTVPNSLGVAGLLFSTAGLNISTICDNEAAPTVYAESASNVQAVATLGTYAAPAAGKCSFSQVDAVNHKGVYELQFANARFAVTNSNGNAKSMIVTIAGITGLSAQCDALIPLTDIDPYSRAGLFQSALTENYASVGVAPTPEQALMWLYQQYSMFSISGTSLEIFKLNGTSQAGILTLNSASTPTAAQRTA